VKFYDELFCAQAGTAPNSIDPACVTSKTYSYETVGGVAETVISENWSILSDFSGRF
jgi:hypothetical protein